MDICRNCPHFKAEAKSEMIYSDVLVEVRTEVICQHTEICQRVMQEMLKKVCPKHIFAGTINAGNIEVVEVHPDKHAGELLACRGFKRFP